MMYIWHVSSPLGGITLAGDEGKLSGLWFDGQKHFAEGLPAGVRERCLPVFEETMQWLDFYFSGKIPDFTPALHLQAAPFRRKVWEVLLTIPYGQTLTYGEIAARISGNSASSARAVGGAVGHNPVSLIIPCHRVVGAGGRLTGYAGGLERKQWLLEMERSVSAHDRKASGSLI